MIMYNGIKVLSGKISLGSYKCSKPCDELFSLDTTSAASYGKLCVPDSYVQDTQGAGTNFFKASAAWTNVGSHTGASTVQNWAKNKVIHNTAGGADKKFYEAKQILQQSRLTIQLYIKHLTPERLVHRMLICKLC